MVGGNSSQSPVPEAEMIGTVEAMLRDRLPANWGVAVERPDGSPVWSSDALLRLRAPSGSTLAVAVEVKRLVEPRDVPRLRERLNRELDRGVHTVGLVAARYLSPSVRTQLIEAGLSFADATGNLHLRADEPAVFVADRGADSDPWRGRGRPLGTLKGAPAAQVVRALLDRRGPWKIRQLIDASNASTGSVYRVVEFLESEALLVRDDRGLMHVPDWSKLLRRWSEDYQFLSTNAVTRWIAPRGVESAIRLASESGQDDYAVTGSVAAASWAPYAPARSIMAFTSNPTATAERWGLRPTETGANILLAAPQYPALVAGVTRRADGLVIAATAQVAADLLNGPGRAPNEAEELMDWMKTNESIWR